MWFATVCAISRSPRGKFTVDRQPSCTTRPPDVTNVPSSQLYIFYSPRRPHVWRYPPREMSTFLCFCSSTHPEIHRCCRPRRRIHVLRALLRRVSSTSTATGVSFIAPPIVATPERFVYPRVLPVGKGASDRQLDGDHRIPGTPRALRNRAPKRYTRPQTESIPIVHAPRLARQPY